MKARLLGRHCRYRACHHSPSQQNIQDMIDIIKAVDRDRALERVEIDSELEKKVKKQNRSEGDLNHDSGN